MSDIPNYYERAIALLASQFQIALPDGTKSNFQKLIYAIETEIQEIQNQETLLQTLRYLNTAMGIQLDGIGQILGLPRQSGQPDDDAIIDGIPVTGYRQDLQFQIFINSSSGTPEQMIYILGYLTDASRVFYSEVYPAAYQMATNGLTFPFFPTELVSAIQSVSPAGVKFIGITAIYDTNPFTFSEDPETSQLFVSPNETEPYTLNPFQANPGSGAEDFYVQGGETSNPDFGGGFSEAILIAYPIYNFDNVGAGQFAEIIQLPS